MRSKQITYFSFPFLWNVTWWSLWPAAWGCLKLIEFHQSPQKLHRSRTRGLRTQTWQGRQSWWPAGGPPTSAWLQDGFVDLLQASSPTWMRWGKKCFFKWGFPLLSLGTHTVLGCVPDWRWGTPPLPRLSSWTEVWWGDVEARQIHGRHEMCSTTEHPTCSDPHLYPPGLCSRTCKKHICVQLLVHVDSGTSKLTSFPSMEIEGKGHPLLCWQRQDLSEVPQRLAAIFTANLDVKKQKVKM